MKPTVRERLRYAFDNSMAKGTRALIAWLAVVTFLMMVVYAIVVIAFGIMPEEVADKSFVETLWYALMRAMDAGALGGDAGSWPFLLTNFAITLGGIFVVSALIGVLNAGLEARIDEMRKGRSKVIESDHVLILGFTSAIDTVLSELTIANENARDACVVILSERDKVEMEDELRARVPDTGRVRVVCRSGNPADPIDLDMVNVQGTKSIIVLSPEDEDPDITVIKAILAITNAPNRRAEPYHIVAAVKDEKNVAVAKMVGKAEVSVVLIGDLISRITVQTCRQSGLSVVHTELLDFDGDEIYIAEAPELVGKTLGEALFLYPESAVIGIRTSEGPRVLPPLDTRIQKGDRIIAISRDDDTLVASTDAPEIRRGADRGGAAEDGGDRAHPRAGLQRRCARHRTWPRRLRGARLVRAHRRRHRRSQPRGGGHRTARVPAARGAHGRYHGPQRARVHQARDLRPHPGDVQRRPPGPARRRARAGHAAAPARDGRAAEPRLLHRERDARRAEPAAGRDHASRRLHREREAGELDDVPDRRERGPVPRAHGPLRSGRRGDLPEAHGPLRADRAGHDVPHGGGSGAASR
ncbi:MAG: hypothetical protein IPH72_03215 [Sandaracinaceae bacterium]|nr:hypothetical protein [Sandaracinaceae bacterium]